MNNTLLEQIKEKLIILLKSFNSFFKFFKDFYTSNNDIIIYYPTSNNPDNLPDWSLQTLSVPSLKKIYSDINKYVPKSTFPHLLNKVSKGFVRRKLGKGGIYTVFVEPDLNPEIMIDLIDNLDIFNNLVIQRTNDEYNDSDYQGWRGTIYPLTIPIIDNKYKIPNENKYEDIEYHKGDNFLVPFERLFPYIPRSTVIDDSVNSFMFIFANNIIPITILHSLKFIRGEFSLNIILSDFTIKLDLGPFKRIKFKNYGNNLLNCDILSEDNTYIYKFEGTLDWGERNRYFKVRETGINITKFHILKDLELGIKKNHLNLKIEKFDNSNDFIYIQKQSGGFLRHFNYLLYTPILYYNGNQDGSFIEYTRSVVNIKEIHLTKVELLRKLNDNNKYPFSVHGIPSIFWFGSIEVDNNLLKDYPNGLYEKNLTYFSNIYNWNIPNNNTGKINFTPNIINEYEYNDVDGFKGYSANSNSPEVIYGIIIIINSIPILYCPYLRNKPNGYFYNVIYNPNDISNIKNLIKYENTQIIPVFYNGYEIVPGKEYTLYGKRYPYNLSLLSIAPFFGVEYTHNGKNYLLPIILNLYSAAPLNERPNQEQLPESMYNLFTNYITNKTEIPNEFTMFNVYNLNILHDNNSYPEPFLLYKLLGTLSYFITGEYWQVNTEEGENGYAIPFPAIRMDLEFHSYNSSLVVENLDYPY